MIKVFLVFVTFVVVFFLSCTSTFAQESVVTNGTHIASESTKVSSASTLETSQIEKIKKSDITKPEESKEKEEIILLFANRPVSQLSLANFIAYTVQFAVKQGVPANTVTLILLLPFLATFVAFIRHVIGLPSLEMLVPVTLSVTLLSTGITAGFILLLTIMTASFFSRVVLKKIRIMQLPKMALSLFAVSLFVFLTLTMSAVGGILIVKQLSIFPILMFILLSDKIVAIQLERSLQETLIITFVTIGIGISGYIFLSTEVIQSYILLYPEVALLLIPLNIIIGRYFGLRLTEVYRFSSIQIHANK